MQKLASETISAVTTKGGCFISYCNDKNIITLATNNNYYTLISNVSIIDFKHLIDKINDDHDFIAVMEPVNDAERSRNTYHITCYKRNMENLKITNEISNLQKEKDDATMYLKALTDKINNLQLALQYN